MTFDPQKGTQEGLEFDEANERSWRGYLRDFKENVYPVFQEYGFTLAEAFLAWQMNRINNNVIDVETAINGDEE